METPMNSYIVGIDIAKQSHKVCILHAPDGKIIHKPFSMDATLEGVTHLLEIIRQLPAAGSCVVGMESTGILWEPLYDALTQAGYPVVLLNPRQTASWAESLGLASQNRCIGCLDDC